MTVSLDTSILIGIARSEKEADTALQRITGMQQVICDVVLSEGLPFLKNKARQYGLI